MRYAHDHAPALKPERDTVTSRYQKARRWAFWRGFTISLLVYTGWILLSAFAGHLTR
ncbi:hypothetical protein NRB16_24630 [Pseudomonas sp. LJDD11]|uniref:hypothetical protein n=1 Tax=unclassified Pseudomonas TaxID=196821 RepID=UPI0020976BCA|nr:MULTISPECIES: hypothetical protein [unclassified Pseudomonas]MCO8160946.1 hypothetical protein [Pseudomonas sp. 21LCFQ010]MCQ9426711.1 hypothetical protein [Pseudomonas sp. LJDD11]